MPRVIRNIVDYFPHFTNSSEGDTLTILQDKYKSDGYATWFRLLEKLGSTENHFLDLRDPQKKARLLAKLHLPEDQAFSILNTLSELNAIDKDLWEHKIIWCQNFVDKLESLYRNRKRTPPIKPIITIERGISTVDIKGGETTVETIETPITTVETKRETTVETIEKGISTIINPITTVETIEKGISTVSTPEIPQSKVKESKVKESRGITTVEITDFQKIADHWFNSGGLLTSIDQEEFGLLLQENGTEVMREAIDRAKEKNKISSGMRVSWLKLMIADVKNKSNGNKPKDDSQGHSYKYVPDSALEDHKLEPLTTPRIKLSVKK